MGAGGTYPAFKIEFAWGVDAVTVPTAGQWVDESDYLLAWSTKIGTEDEFSQPGAGTLLVTLDGSTGRFDPDNTSGALYGNLKPLTWVRLLGGTTTATTTLFVGQVSIQGFSLNASQFAGAIEVNVSVLDRLEFLANVDAPGSVYEIEMRTDTQRVWWRLGESSGTTALDSSGNNRHATYEGGATFNTRSGLVANDSNNAIEFDAVDDVLASPWSTGLSGTGSFSVEGWFATTATTGTVYIAAQGHRAVEAIAGSWDLTYSADLGTVYFRVDFDDASAAVSGLNDGDPHHVVGVRDGGTLRLYVDGTQVDTGATVVSLVQHPIAVGSPGWDLAPSTGSAAVATIDEVAVYDSALSAARVLAHYNAGTSPWSGGRTGDRVSRLLDIVAWDNLLRSLDMGETTTTDADIAGGDLLSLIQDQAVAEGGRFYVDHYNGGMARFESRHERLTATRSTTSQATFGDGGGSEVPYSAIDIQDDRIINTAHVQRFNGSTVTAEDATSQTTYLERSYSETGLLTTSDTEVVSRANALVAERKDRRRRVRSMVLEPRGDSHPAWSHVFARRLGDRVTVKWRPPYGGTYTYTCWIIGIAHDWDQRAAAWRSTFWLEPVPYGATAEPYFIISTSTIESDARIGW